MKTERYEFKIEKGLTPPKHGRASPLNDEIAKTLSVINVGESFAVPGKTISETNSVRAFCIRIGKTLGIKTTVSCPQNATSIRIWRIA